MKEFSGRIAVVTGGGSRHGGASWCACWWPRAVMSPCAMSSMHGMDGDPATVRGDGTSARPACHRASRRRVQRSRRHALSRRSRKPARDRPYPSAVQQCRDRRRRQHDRNSRDEWERTFNICWGGVYLATRAFPAPAAGGGRSAYRQHQQHERLLGLDWPWRAAHGLFGGEVRGERILRGPDDRSPAECTAHQGLGRHARTYRHRLSHQLAQGPDRQRSG